MNTLEYLQICARGEPRKKPGDNFLMLVTVLKKCNKILCHQHEELFDNTYSLQSKKWPFSSFPGILKKLNIVMKRFFDSLKI